MDTTATAIDIVKEAWDALEAGDRAKFGELLAADAVYTDSTAFLHKPEFRGREEILDFLFAMHHAYPDMQLQIVDIFSAGDKVVLQGFVSGTHTRETELHGLTVPATDKRITLPICQVCTIEDRKITRADSYYDAGTVNVQLGFVLHRAAVPA
jgi:steroid delta-isomerase-like uncharacterized protein